MRFKTVAGAASVLLASIATAGAQMMPGGPWQGFYSGVNVGAAWLDAHGTLSPTGCFATVGGCGPTAGGGGASRSFSRSFNASGVIGGAQAGFNWLVAPQWLVGLETDFAGTSAGNSTNNVFSLSPPLQGSATVHSSASQDYLGTVRGRVGFLAVPELLLFGTGGFAYGHQSGSASITFSRAGDTYSGSSSNLRTGWAAGGGAEWLFAPQWSLKAEYLYVDLGAGGSQDLTVTNPNVTGVNPGAGFHSSLSSHENVFRIGVNFHFWVPPPPPAPVVVPPPPPPAPLRIQPPVVRG